MAWRCLLAIGAIVIAPTASGCSSDGEATPPAGDAAPSGQCIGQENAVHAEYATVGADGGPTTELLPVIAKRCGFQCLGQNLSDECVNGCIQQTIKGAITDACTLCTVGSVRCGAENCLSICTGTDPVPCDACVCGGNSKKINCLDAYEACAGIASTTCT